MSASAIEWTEATWNPVTGCSKVSPGCAHCYAERISLRFGRSAGPWTPANAAENVVLHPERLDQPLRWKRPRMIFVNSMSDLFHELVPDDFIARVFAVMADTAHTFQILTKRPERAKKLLGGAWIQNEAAEWSDAGFFGDMPWPLPNVWLGVSIENRRFIHRADLLRETPAAVRFISAEPLLGPLFGVVPCMTCRKGPDAIGVPGSVEPWGEARGTGGAACPDCQGTGVRDSSLDLTDMDWLIVGGESGPGHRPIHPRWVDELRRECQETGVAFFFKQWGGHTPKSGGRLLDGRTWDEMPSPSMPAVPNPQRAASKGEQ